MDGTDDVLRVIRHRLETPGRSPAPAPASPGHGG
jgi:hypothetical protein